MASYQPFSCAELQGLYVERGLAIAAIARQAGCSAPTVANWLRRCGVPIRTGRFATHDLPRELLERLYTVEGLSLRACAARLGVSASTVSNRLKAYGIPRRPVGWHSTSTTQS